MVGGWLKGSPCLQRADEGPIVQAPSGVLLHPPTPRSPRGISEPRSVGARIPCPGRGSALVEQSKVLTQDHKGSQLGMHSDANGARGALRQRDDDRMVAFGAKRTCMAVKLRRA